jgi:hypothetical protein
MKDRLICDRCHSPIKVSIMSKLNTDILCMACKKDERALPTYQAGADAETKAVRCGDYNFPGVGLTPGDQEFLAKRRAARNCNVTASDPKVDNQVSGFPGFPHKTGAG